jgi:hypothetical protein
MILEFVDCFKSLFINELLTKSSVNHQKLIKFLPNIML